jgi:hypothetical protein
MIAPDTWDYRTPIIPTKIVECDFDSTFVIARQQELRRRSPADPGDQYMEPTPGKYHYWILDVRLPQVYGPLNSGEFAEQRERLKVPTQLTLKDVYLFRP